ncbi:ABC transporter substrate-binding protein [Maridesulfovibrio salexigens]|uniref:Extracellular ligand-binding receptor n=1 Tax=Maridesulfovibrio salexigens (strain ATCC 14822 / DSM 2638 / NCIMB 8403 / VKM B-1763) TaxID=526222 RepID=C6C1M4_MARSD|nr:ABC transporter substrate-binding protein [Maridesulfovibrio salexigens]ACS81199.1 Extracellular ligand-binding receptor [Maridesulfovibrio salexigens DSM 2638]
MLKKYFKLIEKGIFLWLLFLCLSLSACSDDPIRLGFSGTLKGKYSDLGVQGRNGALLAVEDINEAGGIDGRKIELIVRDDQNTPEGAVKADKELIAEGVSVIIGHMTSSQSMTAVRDMADSNVVYISPTTSTPLLQGIKDNFFRVIPTLTDLSKGLAEYSVDELDKRRLAVVWDNSNPAFTAPYKDVFVEKFAAKGGDFVGAVSVGKHEGSIDWQKVVDELKGMNPDTVVMVTSARDLAGFAQFCTLNKTNWTILSSMWGYTKELIQTGGKSVEGIIFVVHFAEDDPEKLYVDFKDRFIKRFGWPPNFAAVFGYQAVQVFAEAVKRNGGRTKGLGGAITGISFDDSLVGPFEIDEFGDVKRNGHIVTVKDGHFVTVSKREK